eukprot:TRINITY_DN103389_c0_g1_i1.p1 TRINITY_DN103389_c0_g1~~TRINITY_DN103389_c0_g1_i1.p1  ORF type:complete len:1015 (+),score=210.40 TRINITY_DN103389_c0_g1_i1:170-3214(+)
MAGDVHVNVFGEEQLFNSDVRGEDEEEDEGGEKKLAASSDLPSAATVAAEKPKPPKAAKAAVGSLTPSLSAAPGAVVVSVRERRRKRAAERATKIVYWLETKYDVLSQVCSSLENWKEATSGTIDFDLLWCDTAIPADRFMKLKPYQKMNHFVGMSSITRKNNLGRNLLRMRKQYPKEYKFFPDTWILPTDLSDFKQQFSNSKRQTFIVKPDNGCQGKGIFLIRDVEKVPVDFSTTYVAQRYIHRPFLLDGFKFDLRLYVLVSGCDPLRIFLHRRGLVRLASEPYVEPVGKNLSQNMIHLTNYAINKLNPNFEENTNPDDAQDGHKRSWEAVQEHLRKDGHDVDALLIEIEDLIIKTLITVQPSLSHFYHSCQPDDLENSMCFEILGFDVILDYKLQPWLLEVNHAPSFATESELDNVVKEQVLRDTFDLIDLSPEARRQKKKEAREKMEARAMGQNRRLCLEERAAQEREGALARTSWEEQVLQKGNNGYKRLYPSEQQEQQYWQVHETAISIWEMLMGGSSRRAVRLSQPEDAPIEKDSKDDKTKPRTSTKTENAADGDAPLKPGGPKRTPEEIREVVDRLMQGFSALPRKERANRQGFSAGSATKAAESTEGDEQPEESMIAEEDNKTAPSYVSSSGKNARPEVQVGDVIKVQTNLGWELVTVRAKRNTGKIDIQFKDGEYMRSVLPRILKEPFPQEASSSEPPSAGDAATSSQVHTSRHNASSSSSSVPVPHAASQKVASRSSAAAARGPSWPPALPLGGMSQIVGSGGSGFSEVQSGGLSPGPAGRISEGLPPSSPQLPQRPSEPGAHGEVENPDFSFHRPAAARSPTQGQFLSGTVDDRAGSGVGDEVAAAAGSAGRRGSAYCSGASAGSGAAAYSGGSSSSTSYGYSGSGSPDALVPPGPASRVGRERSKLPVSSEPQNSSSAKPPQVRLRQQLNQLISVRPIVMPRGKGAGIPRNGQPSGLAVGGTMLGSGFGPSRGEASADLAIPKVPAAYTSKQVSRRKTYGDH